MVRILEVVVRISEVNKNLHVAWQDMTGHDIRSHMTYPISHDSFTEVKRFCFFFYCYLQTSSALSVVCHSVLSSVSALTVTFATSPTQLWQKLCLVLGRSFDDWDIWLIFVKYLLWCGPHSQDKAGGRCLICFGQTFSSLRLQGKITSLFSDFFFKHGYFLLLSFHKLQGTFWLRSYTGQTARNIGMWTVLSRVRISLVAVMLYYHTEVLSIVILPWW